MKETRLIIIDGLNGAGKSTVAKLLHAKLKRTALISYDKIKRLISDFTPNEEYHAIANYVVRAMAKEYLVAGVDTIIESYIPTVAIANRYLGLARRKNVQLFYYQLEAPLHVRAERIRQRPLVEGAKKKMTLEHIKKNDDFYLSNKYNRAKVIKTHNLTPDQVTRIILKDVQEN